MWSRPRRSTRAPLPGVHRGVARLRVHQLGRRAGLRGPALLRELGNGTWQGGWTARHIEADGRIVAERNGVRFWVPPEEYRSLGGAVTIDRPGAVRIPKEYFELASGFYLAHGNADDTRDAGNTVRVYWHLAPTGAARLVGLMTHHLNQAGIGFQLKVLGEPLRYHRTDPAVLYLARADSPGHGRSCGGFMMRSRPGCDPRSLCWSSEWRQE